MGKCTLFFSLCIYIDSDRAYGVLGQQGLGAAHLVEFVCGGGAAARYSVAFNTICNDTRKCPIFTIYEGFKYIKPIWVKY